MKRGAPCKSFQKRSIALSVLGHWYSPFAGIQTMMRSWSCALEAEADYLVTGDVDLLELRTFKGIRIVTPRDFEMFFND